MNSKSSLQRIEGGVSITNVTYASTEILYQIFEIYEDLFLKQVFSFDPPDPTD